MALVRSRFTVAGIAALAVLLLLMPEYAMAASFDGSQLSLPWVIPFACMLLSIAVFPLVAPEFWHHHFGKIAAGWGFAFLIPFAFVFGFSLAVENFSMPW